MKNENGSNNKRQIKATEAVKNEVKKEIVDFIKKNKLFKRKKDLAYQYCLNINGTKVVLLETESDLPLRLVKPHLVSRLVSMQKLANKEAKDICHLIKDNRKEIEATLFNMNSNWLTKSELSEQLEFQRGKGKITYQSYDGTRKEIEHHLVLELIVNTTNLDIRNAYNYLKQLNEKRIFIFQRGIDQSFQVEFLTEGLKVFILDTNKLYEKKLISFCYLLIKGKHYGLERALNTKTIQNELGDLEGSHYPKAGQKISEYLMIGTKSKRASYLKKVNLLLGRDYTGNNYFLNPLLTLRLKS